MAKYISDAEMAEIEKYYPLLIEDNELFKRENGRERLALVETHGCQQNENDSERIRGMLKNAGFTMTDDLNKADLIVFNTCAVRENAEDKIFGRIGILKHMKEEKRDLMIVLAGCMVQQEHIAEKIKKTHTQVDLVMGTHSLYKFPSLLYRAYNQKKAVIAVENSDGAICEQIPVLYEHDHKAWVSIMYGCNNFCTYCVVPYVRGRERSRKPENILSEIKTLVASGVTEVTLLGQNVNSYGKDLEEDIDFSDLIRMVNDIDGLKRIRFMTSHPKDFGDKLILAMQECEKICPQLHLPFQSGSDKVLADMNRRYTREEYLEKLKKAKEAIPNLATSTDIIVGFPTETQADFEDTVSLLEEAEFDMIFSFIYSKREGTPAAKMTPVLSDEEIHKNFDRMLSVQNEISLKKNKAYEGKEVEVLVDSVSKTDKNMLTARTDTGKIVNFKGDEDLIGKYVNVTVTKAQTWSLYGELRKEV
ncbi:MAG: tRNA (N6-isopentenyl adenosine(37)-C2)-methylthiotransferase MiaB [Clostridia bacterium]|nr:tRNA (N6-isopentenyl adenosine(37)-C2)-methylthiotransferase MiaB [Clostridia bacterium]